MVVYLPIQQLSNGYIFNDIGTASCQLCADNVQLGLPIESSIAFKDTLDCGVANLLVSPLYFIRNIISLVNIVV